MKAIMYHYVRRPDAALPYFRHLHADAFLRQLDWFEATYPCVTQKRFRECLDSGQTAPGFVLTFDDGLSDHYEFVFHALKARGLWGWFFVPTRIFGTEKLLDVHRIHVILGRFGGPFAVEAMKQIVTDDMLSEESVESFRNSTYASQDNDNATTFFKQTLNYFISYEFRETVLDQLMINLFGHDGEAAMHRKFYATRPQLKRMHAEGMLIGSHGVGHFVMSKLSISEQRREVEDSFGVISEITGEPTNSFCFPYGGFHTFSKETLAILAENGCQAAFNVEPRDISDTDLVTRPALLPRYDCNQFPHGSVHPLAQFPATAIRRSGDTPTNRS